MVRFHYDIYKYINKIMYNCVLYSDPCRVYSRVIAGLWLPYPWPTLARP